MMTNRSRRAPLLLLLLGALCCIAATSCATGPNPADVQSDRDRWRAVRDASADGAIDAAEAPLLAELLVTWDEKLSIDEQAAKTKQGPREILVEILRVYGPAMVQEFLAPDLQARAPEMFRLVDKNGDGLLSQAEMLAIDPLSPVFALVVTSTVRGLLKKPKRG